MADDHKNNDPEYRAALVNRLYDAALPESSLGQWLKLWARARVRLGPLLRRRVALLGANCESAAVTEIQISQTSHKGRQNKMPRQDRSQKSGDAAGRGHRKRTALSLREA